MLTRTRQRLLNVLIVALIALGCSDKDSGASDTPATGEHAAPPIESAQLADWLRSRHYQSYASESSVHASSGPHGYVKVFFDDLLQSSRLAGDPSHPIGSAAVKEMHDEEQGPLTGWVVSVKLADNAVKEDWLWYQLALGEQTPSVNKAGQAICASCHQAGTDYVLSPPTAP
jgi:hypothetical protein